MRQISKRLRGFQADVSRLLAVVTALTVVLPAQQRATVPDEQEERTEQAAALIQAEQAEYAAAPDDDQSDRAERATTLDRPDRADRAERAERAERAATLDDDKAEQLPTPMLP